MAWLDSARCFFVLQLSAALVSVASAQPTESPEAIKTKAREKLALAEKAFSSSDFSRAGLLYVEAYEILIEAKLGAPADLLYNAGLSYERAGSCERAIALFDRFLKANPSGTTKALQKRIDEAKRCAPEVAIQSNPPGADVKIDGKLRGKTPVTLNLRSGAHTLGLYLKGHRPLQRAFAVERGKPLALTLKMEPAGIGRLAFNILVPAAIYLDGEKIGDGPYRGVQTLSAGPHRVRIERDGCAPRALTVDVPDGEKEPIEIESLPVCAPREPKTETGIQGGLGVETQPELQTSVAPWVVGAIGVASLVVSGGLALGYLDAAGARDDALGCVFNCSTEEQNTIRSKNDLGYRLSISSAAALGVGVVGLVVSTVLWLMSD